MSDAPDLAAALSALPGVKIEKGPSCSVAECLGSLAERDPAAHTVLLQVIDRPDVNAAVLARTLASHGFTVKAHTLRRHRARKTGTGCACPIGL